MITLYIISTIYCIQFLIRKNKLDEKYGQGTYYRHHPIWYELSEIFVLLWSTITIFGLIWYIVTYLP